MPRCTHKATSEMVNGSSDPGDDHDNELTRQLQADGELEALELQLQADGELKALELPLSSEDATGAPPPGKVGRAAWRAIAVCIDRDIDFPDWVRSYLRTTADRTKQITENDRTPNRDDVTWAVDLGPGWKKYDPIRDPENVYCEIQQWIDAGKVNGPSEGARLYIKKVLKDRDAKEDTVRGWFKEGRKIVMNEVPDLGTNYNGRDCL